MENLGLKTIHLTPNVEKCKLEGFFSTQRATGWLINTRVYHRSLFSTYRPHLQRRVSVYGAVEGPGPTRQRTHLHHRSHRSGTPPHRRRSILHVTGLSSASRMSWAAATVWESRRMSEVKVAPPRLERCEADLIKIIAAIIQIGVIIRGETRGGKWANGPQQRGNALLWLKQTIFGERVSVESLASSKICRQQHTSANKSILVVCVAVFSWCMELYKLEHNTQTLHKSWNGPVLGCCSASLLTVRLTLLPPGRRQMLSKHASSRGPRLWLREI